MRGIASRGHQHGQSCPPNRPPPPPFAATNRTSEHHAVATLANGLEQLQAVHGATTQLVSELGNLRAGKVRGNGGKGPVAMMERCVTIFELGLTPDTQTGRPLASYIRQPCYLVQHNQAAESRTGDIKLRFRTLIRTGELETCQTLVT
jgi:hypothetical protein